MKKIVLSTALILVLVGCGSEKENKIVQKIEPKKVEAVKKVEETKIEVKEEVVPKEKKII